MVVRQHGHRGGVAALLVAAVLASSVAATGCSKRDARADERARASGDLALVRAAADALIRSGSSRARTSMETANGGTRVVIRGRGGFDYGRGLGRLRVVLPEDAAGSEERRPVTELLAPGELYMKDRGAGVPPDKWVRVDTTGLPDGNLVTGGATDPLAAAALLRGAREVRYVGRARADEDGTVVRHFRGISDLRRAAERASRHARGALAAAARGFSTRVVPFDVFLDGEGVPRKMRHRFTFAEPGDPDGGRGGRGDGGERGDRGRDGGGQREPGPEVEVISTTVLYAFG
ncbi:hypothetical protein, partial [Streptomyces sp. NPDC048845]|uniref:hypothetical protein n=1 Tax=Streptomyces sp. NPDC048845 TaxID=3155390 RepID=UPI00342F3BAE